jgi:hypothetical protein
VYYKMPIMSQLCCSTPLILAPSGNQMLLIGSYQNARCDLYLGSVFDQQSVWRRAMKLCGPFSSIFCSTWSQAI